MAAIDLLLGGGSVLSGARLQAIAVIFGFALAKTAAASDGHGSAVAPDPAWLWEPRFLKKYKLAVCNDGSDAAYYYRPGPAGARSWTVFLEGGAWCWDSKSCGHGGSSKHFPRDPMSVAEWAAQNLRGLFAPGDSPLARAHTAFVRSCSRDAFLGDAGPSKRLRLHFRGRRILEAVFADLRAREGLGAEWGDRVALAGCGSGARGAMLSIDHVSMKWAGKADVVGILDSPLWAPLQPLNPGIVSLEDQTRAFLEVANVDDILDENCKQTFRGAERWKCLFGGFQLPFVTSPYLLVQSQYDSFGILAGLDAHFSARRWLNSTELVYAEKYRELLVASLPRSFRGDSVVFSSACYLHCTVTSDQIYALRAAGASLPELLARWLDAPASVRGAWFREDCTGFNCGLVPGGDRSVVV